MFVWVAVHVAEWLCGYGRCWNLVKLREALGYK